QPTPMPAPPDSPAGRPRQESPAPVPVASASPSPTSIPEGEGKQPWEMTLEDVAKVGYIAYDQSGNAFVNTRGGGRGVTEQLRANHEEEVAKAIREGRPVPPEVLKD